MMDVRDELLMKYLAGEASTAEQQQVHAWAGANAENDKHLSRLRTIWEESRNIAATAAVDEQAAWERFQSRTQRPRRIPVATRWMKVAAALLLLAGGGALTYTMMQPAPVAEIARTIPAPVNTTYTNKTMEAPAVASETADKTSETVALPVKEEKIVRPTGRTKKFLKMDYPISLNSYKHTPEFICNATPCPLEICIIQNVKCADGGYTTESTCSMLEPDESGQLRYKAMDRITKNCVASIEEIRITQVNTGETIVLNEDSKTTARDFFKYITGQKKGDVLAGMFHTNCNNEADDCGLSYDNNHGQLMMH